MDTTEPVTLNYWFHVPRGHLAYFVNHRWAAEYHREVGPCGEDATMLDCRVSLPLTGRSAWSNCLRWQSTYNILSIDHIGAGEGWDPRTISVATFGATPEQVAELTEGLSHLEASGHLMRTVDTVHVDDDFAYRRGRRNVVDKIQLTAISYEDLNGSHEAVASLSSYCPVEHVRSMSTHRFRRQAG